MKTEMDMEEREGLGEEVLDGQDPDTMNENLEDFIFYREKVQ